MNDLKFEEMFRRWNQLTPSKMQSKWPYDHKKNVKFFNQYIELINGFHKWLALAAGGTEGSRITDDEWKRILDSWFAHEHLLKKHDVFFFMQRQLFWRYGQGVDNRWIESWERHDRNKLAFGMKFRYSVPPIKEGANLDDVLPDGMRNEGRIFCSQRYFNSTVNYLTKTDSNGCITVYRGFWLQRGAKIRKGVTIIGNKRAHEQEAGAGFSYSLSRNEVTNHGGHDLHKFFLEDIYGFKTSEERKKHRGKRVGSTKKWFNTIMEEDVHYVMGTYKVKPKDMVFASIGIHDEVVVKPSKVRLKRYDYVTWLDIYAGKIITRLMNITRRKMGEGKSAFLIDEKSLWSIYKELGRIVREHGAEQKIHDVDSVWHTLDDYISVFITERGGKSFLDVKRRDGGSINNSVQRNKALRSLVDLRFDYKSDGMESVLRYRDLYYIDVEHYFRRLGVWSKESLVS